jgi:hypothetical protein
VHVLRSHSPIRLPLRGAPALSFPLRRYAEALALLAAQAEAFAAGRSASPSAVLPSLIAWIFSPDDVVRLHAAALESHGLPLESVLFLESRAPAATLQSVCELDAVRAVVVEGRPTPGALRTAYRWTKPASAAGVFKADVMESFPRDKLVVFLD